MPNEPGNRGGTSSVAAVTPGTPSSAVDLAMTQLGLHERRDRADIIRYLDKGGAGMDPARAAWCAQFVNSTLAQTGIKGTGSPAAGSFTRWGTSVGSAADVQSGDVGVVRGKSPRTGLEGKHVGFLTGEKKYDRAGNVTHLEMLGGNQGQDNVNKRWYSASALHLRRAILDQGNNREIAQRVRGDGQIRVDVNAPRGTRVSAKGGGIFKQTIVNRQVQMTPTQTGPAMSWGEE